MVDPGFRVGFAVYPDIEQEADLPILSNGPAFKDSLLRGSWDLVTTVVSKATNYA